MPEYLVPREVKTRTEIFPGFGYAELGAVLLGAVIGAILQLVPWVLPIAAKTKTVWRLLCLCLPIGGSYLLVHQNIAGGSLLQELLAYRSWAGRRKVLYFRSKDKL